MPDLKDLELIIRTDIPIIMLETFEESKALDLCQRLAVKVNKFIYSWTVTEGLRRIDLDLPADSNLNEPTDVLKNIKSNKQGNIYVLIDFHHYLEDPVNLRLVKEIALSQKDNDHVLIFVSHKMDLNSDLQKHAARVEIKMPDRDKLVQIVKEEANNWSALNANKKVHTTQKTLDRLVMNLTGLTESDARRLARKAIFDDGAITESDMPGVMQAKYDLLDQGGLLSFEFETEKFADVGGMSNIKEWLKLRKDIFHDTSNTVLEPPKGILLLGVQGCGKSLAAKAVAGLFAVPLLRLDFGTLYNKYYGESEKNLRQSLKMAEVMSPCVLWIDEIEKGLSGGSDDDGVSRRILGTLLTWMADREQSVFLVATANDIETLPPELIRKGRFDEIFFVDLPKADVREIIFGIHLNKRDQKSDAFDLKKLAEVSDGFSGAEIEQAIVSALYTAYGSKSDLTTESVLAELEKTKPLSVVMAERIQGLRLWAQARTVPAD